MTSPLLGLQHEGTWVFWSCLQIWYEFSGKPYTLQWITAQRSGVLATSGQCSLGGEHADTWPMQAQPRSLFYLWLPDRWWWLFLLCHQMVLEFSDFGSTSKHAFEWREIDWVTKKSQFAHLAGQRMQNMELGKAKPLDLRWSHGKWRQVFIISICLVASSLGQLFQDFH